MQPPVAWPTSMLYVPDFLASGASTWISATSPSTAIRLSLPILLEVMEVRHTARLGTSSNKDVCRGLQSDRALVKSCWW